jgi:hypothetical protein
MATAESFKLVGDLSGNQQPMLLKVPMDNVAMCVGDSVTLFNSASAGYLGLNVTTKSILGVIQGIVNPDGTPRTASTGSVNQVSGPGTSGTDGDTYALVSVSPTAVYSVPVATAPTAGTQYIGGGADVTTVTSGAQTIEVVSAGTWSGKTCLVVPFGTKTGIDPFDSTRLRVIIKESELFGIIQT